MADRPAGLKTTTAVGLVRAPSGFAGLGWSVPVVTFDTLRRNR